MQAHRQQLVPVRVPWMVSPSVPYLRLASSESQSDIESAISFIAHFGLEHPQEESTDVPPRKIASPYHPKSDRGAPTGPYQLVRVRLHGHIAGRMLPGFSDREVVNPALYDRSLIPCPYTIGQCIDEWLHQFQHLWMKQRLCPDPLMYEVKESSWCSELGLTRDWKHILVLGHDSYVEVIAKDWDWVSEGAT